MSSKRFKKLPEKTIELPSEDIEKLINFVRQKVFEKYKIKLDLELKIVGKIV